MTARCNIKSMAHEQQSHEFGCPPTSRAPFFFPMTAKKLKFLALDRKSKGNKSHELTGVSFRKVFSLSNNPETCALNTVNLRMLRSRQIVFPEFQNKAETKLFPTRAYRKICSQRSMKTKKSLQQQILPELLQYIDQFHRESLSCEYKVSTPARKARLQCKSQRKNRSFASHDGFGREDIKIQCSKSMFVSRKD